MKKILNSPLLFLTLILLIAILSSCSNSRDDTESYMWREVQYKGHTMITYNGAYTDYHHSPDCEIRDMKVLLDSISTKPN